MGNAAGFRVIDFLSVRLQMLVLVFRARRDCKLLILQTMPLRRYADIVVSVLELILCFCSSVF